MRGSDVRSGKLFSYVDLEQRVPPRHPLRAILVIVNEALADIGSEFEAIYSTIGRPSIAPEKLLRALLLQLFHGSRSYGWPQHTGGPMHWADGVGLARVRDMALALGRDNPRYAPAPLLERLVAEGRTFGEP